MKFKIFHYKDTNGKNCICDIYHHGNGTFIVRERADNPGMSVTNAIEDIMITIMDEYGVHPSELDVYELSDIGYSNVRYVKSQPWGFLPKWKFVPEIEMAKILGIKPNG